MDYSIGYNYDGSNRLINTTNYGGQFEAFTYDNDGNITVKKRPGQEIYLWYVSNTDKINYITVNGSQKTYSYDAKGNVVTDNWKNISGISYDHRNLPLSMTAAGAGTYYYRYDDGGNRIYKNAGSVKEFYLRDAAGREPASSSICVETLMDRKATAGRLAVYDMTTNKLNYIQIIDKVYCKFY